MSPVTARNGVVRQLIPMKHESVERPWLAGSFDELLEWLGDYYEQGGKRE